MLKASAAAGLVLAHPSVAWAQSDPVGTLLVASSIDRDQAFGLWMSPNGDIDVARIRARGRTFTEADTVPIAHYGAVVGPAALLQISPQRLLSLHPTVATVSERKFSYELEESVRIALESAGGEIGSAPTSGQGVDAVMRIGLEVRGISIATGEVTAPTLLRTPENRHYLPVNMFMRDNRAVLFTSSSGAYGIEATIVGALELLTFDTETLDIGETAVISDRVGHDTLDVTASYIDDQLTVAVRNEHLESYGFDYQVSSGSISEAPNRSMSILGRHDTSSTSGREGLVVVEVMPGVYSFESIGGGA